VSSQKEGRRVLEFEEARQIVIDVTRGLQAGTPTEGVSLPDAHGRTLAEAILADRNYPALRRSLRDGFAVMARDLPGTLRIRGEIRAGETEKEALRSGEALEIMTGAPVPDEADAVVMVEHVTRSANGETVTIDKGAERGQFINECGSEARQYAVVIEAGTRLDASHVATLAMVGRTTVPVFRQPRVAILSTGDEIVEVHDAPGPHQIRNSNAFMLASCVTACGGIPVPLPIARDTAGALRPLLEEGLRADMLLISGGVSAGRYDLVKPTLQELGAEFLFDRVRIQPGGPVTFGRAHNMPVFGLPGNPGSSLVTFQLFAQPALQLLGGQREPILPLLRATFEAPFRHRLGLTRFLPARLSVDGERLRHIPWQGSSDIPALSRANAFLVAEHDRETWNIGDSIRVMPKL
jgi:molybdopterin molybdotransferase